MGRGGNKEPPDPVSALLERVHGILYETVGEAVAEVANLDTKWTAGEMTKRISKYLYKGACAEDVLQAQTAKEALVQFVKHAMSSYEPACQEKEWFFEIDLAPAFIAAAWELQNAPMLQRRSCKPLSYEVLQEHVTLEYEEKLDIIMNSKAMWEACKKTFKDDTVVSKVYNALYKCFDVALTESVQDTRHMSDEKRMELFMKRWINESMQRCWNSVSSSERVITEGNVTRLFSNLVAPFGANHPYSCIPSMFFPDGERPPQTWPYIRQAARQMFDSWQREQAAGPSNKKRKKSAAPAPEPMAPEPEEEVDATPDPEAHLEDPVSDDDEMQEDDAVDAGDAGHPECTSQEDCIGCPDDRLVQHYMQGEGGDVYCEACWSSFLDQNKKLEGRFKDTDELYS